MGVSRLGLAVKALRWKAEGLWFDTPSTLPSLQPKVVVFCREAAYLCMGVSRLDLAVKALRWKAEGLWFDTPSALPSLQPKAVVF